MEQTQPIGFYKMQGNEFDFKITEIKGEEQYKVWDNQQKKFLTPGMTLVGTDGKQYQIENTKYIKQVEFQKLFPNNAKKDQVVRKIIVGGQIYRYGFSKSTDLLLHQVIGNVQTLGKNPLEMTYRLSKTGQGLMTRYMVSLSGNQVATPQSFQINITPQHNTVTTPAIQLTSVEIDLVNAYKKQMPQPNWSVDTFVGAGLHNKIADEARLREIYKSQFPQ